MRNGPRSVVHQTVSTLLHLGATGEWSDGELLDRFLSNEDESRTAAFEVLIDRHGPMVLELCRNVLGDHHDAEDAFQATFLILATQARSIRRRGSLGSWLFGVATRVASRARAEAARRRAHEQAFAQDVAARKHATVREDATIALHDEIARLPEKYREPVILCALEGLSYQAAAERLGCPIGTVSVRLMRARERLRTRLLRRGDIVPDGTGIDMLPASPDRQPLPPALIASATKHAAVLAVGRLPGPAAIPSSVTNLAQGVVMTMFVRRFAANTIAYLMLGAVLMGTGVLGYRAMGKGSHPASNPTQPPRAGSEPPKTGGESPAETAANRAKSVDNLRQLGLAIVAYEQANGRLPWSSVRDLNTGKPLLSWRVLVLPWVFGGQELFQEFHLDEAWDSPHNKPLLAKMPAYYAPVGVKTDQPFTTFYQVFVGPGTAFEVLPRNGSLRLEDIRDGAANSLTVVEGGVAVPWTKPDDLVFQPDQPLPRLGGLFKDGFNAAFLDASVFSFARGAEERLLKGLITRDGGESVLRQQLPQIPGTFSEARMTEFTDSQLNEGRVFTVKDRAVLRQLGIAQEACKAIEQRRRRGDRVSEEEYHKWSVRLLEVEQSLSKTHAEKIAALEAHCARMNESRDHAKKLYKTGQLDLIPYLDREYWQKEAAAWLDDAKREPDDAPRH